jgi:hypothetical protein
MISALLIFEKYPINIYRRRPEDLSSNKGINDGG